MYVAWSKGLKGLNLISLLTSFLLIVVVDLMMTLSLYHVILGRGDPLAEQLSRIVSPMFCTVIDVGGVKVKTGGSAKR